MGIPGIGDILIGHIRGIHHREGEGGFHDRHIDALGSTLNLQREAVELTNLHRVIAGEGCALLVDFKAHPILAEIGKLLVILERIA